MTEPNRGGRNDREKEMQANDVSSKTEKKLIATALVSLLLALPGVAKADFTFTTVDVPLAPPPSKLSADTEINGNSRLGVVGQYTDVGGVIHGFTYNGSTFTTIDAPTGLSTVLNGINATGQITGTYQDTKKKGFNAFFLPTTPGTFTTITPPGSVHADAGNINSQGQIVGAFRTSDGYRHGYVWDSVSSTFIVPSFNNPDDAGGPPAGGTVPFGINDGSQTSPPQIVGDFVAGPNSGLQEGARYGFLLSNGAYTTIAPPNAVITVAEGINNSGTIVGVFVDKSKVQHGFMYQNGSYTIVDVPNTMATEINAIDASGDIVGYYVDQSNTTHGFIGTPTNYILLQFFDA